MTEHRASGSVLFLPMVARHFETIPYSPTAPGNEVGEITSGGFGPTFEGPVAMGYVTQNMSTPGTELFAEVRGKSLPCAVCDPIFVQQRYVRSL